VQIVLLNREQRLMVEAASIRAGGFRQNRLDGVA
jgi:hypothetical protein